jgi:hypothetical protein
MQISLTRIGAGVRTFSPLEQTRFNYARALTSSLFLQAVGVGSDTKCVCPKDQELFPNGTCSAALVGKLLFFVRYALCNV